MKRLSLLAWTLLSLAVWGQAGDTSSAAAPTPALPSATGDLLNDRNWQLVDPLQGQWQTWQRGEETLSWGPWTPDLQGQPWRLAAENARFVEHDGQQRLGLERGWAWTVSSNTPEALEDLLALATTLSADGTVRRTFGRSVQGRPLDVVRLGTGPNRTLFLGVFHGDEPAGETALDLLIAYLVKKPETLAGHSVSVCTVVNPDGLRAGTRVNARKVDLNRNFPAKNWDSEGQGTRYWGGPEAGSEPETQALLSLLESARPDKIVSLHAPLHNVNYDGPAAQLAKRMSDLNGYPVEPDIGYPTPGSFGTYIGRERQVPTITLEFPEGSGKAMWLENRSALLEAIRYVP